MKLLCKFVICGFAFLFMSFILSEKKKTRVYLVGDSTIANKESKTFPETGWGMPFTYFFTDSVEVDNRAKNGRSTKSFMAEGLWQPVVDKLQVSDYVFIQFGHNDEVKEKVGRYTTPEEFKNNLVKYITDTRDKKAIPVLLTPVARRSFDSSGRIRETHSEYSNLVRQVAKSTGVAFIDLDLKSQALLQSFGAENSKLLFNHLEKGEHPNYPDGKKDDTHFNELGARKMAQIVLSGIRDLKLPLADLIRNREVKK